MSIIADLLPAVLTLLCGLGLLAELIMLVEFLALLRVAKAADEEAPKP